MAISTVSDISAVMTTALGPDLTRLWNRQANLLANCMDIELSSFKSVFWAASQAGGSSKAVAEGYQFVSGDYNVDTMVACTLNRAQYVDSFSMSDTEIAVATRSPLSPAPLVDLVSERVFECATRVTSKINGDCFTGNGVDGTTGAQNIVGLDSGLITSGSYAGNNVGSVTGLKSNISGSDAAPTALTLDQMQLDMMSQWLNASSKPTHIIAHPYVTRAIQNLFEQNRRIVNMDSPLQRYSSGPTQAFNGADSGLSFMGVPILNDKDGYVSGVPGSGFGHIYYINKPMLKLDVLPHMNQGDTVGWGSSSFVSTAGLDEELVGPPLISITPLARLGLATTFALNIECQMKIKRPGAFGRRLGVAI